MGAAQQALLAAVSGIPQTARASLTGGDSLGTGVLPADGGDWTVLPTGIHDLRQRAPTGVSQLLPLDQASPPDGTNYLSPYESALASLQTSDGLDEYICANNLAGSALVVGAAAWAVGNTMYLNSIARWNPAIATALAAEPGTSVTRFFWLGGTNDTGGGCNQADYYTAFNAMLSGFFTNVYANGVSGATLSSLNLQVIIMSILPECRDANANPFVNLALRQTAAELPNGKFIDVPYGYCLVDNLHLTNPGCRAFGGWLEDVLSDNVGPVLDFPTAYTMYADQDLAYLIEADKYFYPWLTGADAADFEIVWVTQATAGPGSGQASPYLSTVGGPFSPGTKTVTINAKSANGVLATPVNFVLTTVAAYGSEVETIVVTNPTNAFANPPSSDGYGRAIFPSVQLSRGLNFIEIMQTSGSATDVTALVGSTGLVGVRDANSFASSTSLRVGFYVYSGQDQICDFYATPATAPLGDSSFTVTNVVGTAATPSSSYFINANQTTSLTCPTNGVIIGGGLGVSGTTPVAGVTTLAASFYFTGYRTTTGVFGFSETGLGMGAAAFAKT